MMKNAKKLYTELNSEYRKIFDEMLKVKFGDCGFTTEWNIFSMTLVTKWNKNLSTKLNKEIKSYISGFSDGYAKAMNYVGLQR